MAAPKATTLRRIDRRVQEGKCQSVVDLLSPEDTSCVGGGRSYAVSRAARDTSCSRIGRNSPTAGSQCSVGRAGGDMTLRGGVVPLQTDAGAVVACELTARPFGASAAA
eukprot:3632255-Pleurochrysis_carterae.AAC.1